jgi:MraZ protein
MADSDPLFFDGEFDLTLDEKSRVLVPSHLRKSINPLVHGESFYLVISSTRKQLFMYPDRYYKQLMTAGEEADPIPSEVQLNHDRRAFALTQVVEPDKAGRILIPPKMRERTGINREVTFLGVRNHIEIWDRAVWTAASEGLLDAAPQIDERARRLRRGDTGMPTQTVTGMGGQL